MAAETQSSGINTLKARLRLLRRPTVWASAAVMGIALMALISYWRSPNRQTAQNTPTNVNEFQSGSDASRLPPAEDNSIGADLDNVELLLTELSNQQIGADGLQPDQASTPDASDDAASDRLVLPDRFDSISSILNPSTIASSLSAEDGAIDPSSFEFAAPAWSESLRAAETSLSLGPLFTPQDFSASRPVQPGSALLASPDNLSTADANADASLPLRFPLQEFMEAADSRSQEGNSGAIAENPPTSTSPDWATSSPSPTSPLLQGLPYPYWGDPTQAMEERSPLTPLPGTTGYRVPPSLTDLQRQNALGNPPASSNITAPVADPLLVPAPALPSSFTPAGVSPVSPYVPTAVQPTTGLSDSFQVSPAAPPLPTTSQTSTPAPYTGGGRNGRINTFSNP
ncbi:MAG: hypothetical protein ACFB8W_06395 [Elainellaceae cyanobacterium]